MIHYVGINKGASDLATEYPHSPTNYRQSVLDFLEDKLTEGLEFAAYSEVGESFWLFKVVAK